MFTIYDLCKMFVDDNPLIRIYDCSDPEIAVVYEGYYDDMPEFLQDCEVSSIDNPYPTDFDGYIGINVDMDEEFDLNCEED